MSLDVRRKIAFFEELVAVFSNIMVQTCVLDEGYLITSSHVCNDRPSFQTKTLWGKRSFFATKFD